MKRVITKIDFASDEEYFLYEEKSEVRHELINGNLYELSGTSIFHNDIVLQSILLLNQLLNNNNYKMAFESYKVRTPDGNYCYPGVMVCERNAKKYYAERPVLMRSLRRTRHRRILRRYQNRRAVSPECAGSSRHRRRSRHEDLAVCRARCGVRRSG